MDKEFTKKLQEWLNTPADKRDLEQGAKYLLQLTNNLVLYKNLTRNLPAHAQFIEFRLKRYLQFRLQDLTHDEVATMQKQVTQIVQNRGLDNETPAPGTLTEAEQWRGGKRADHDSLPLEIQALYIENASLLQKMRELHLQLRALSTQQTTCPDSDRYPFLKEMIELDKSYHKNWLQYDSYVVAPGTEPANEETQAPSSESVSELNGDSVNADRTPGAPSTESEPTPAGESAAEQSLAPTSEGALANSDSTGADNTPAAPTDQVQDEAARLEQKNIQRKINLAKGRYKKTPTDALKESILSLYKQLTAPADSLTEELKQLGIL